MHRAGSNPEHRQLRRAPLTSSTLEVAPHGDARDLDAPPCNPTRPATRNSAPAHLRCRRLSPAREAAAVPKSPWCAQTRLLLSHRPACPTPCPARNARVSRHSQNPRSEPVGPRRKSRAVSSDGAKVPLADGLRDTFSSETYVTRGGFSETAVEASTTPSIVSMRWRTANRRRSRKVQARPDRERRHDEVEVALGQCILETAHAQIGGATEGVWAAQADCSRTRRPAPAGRWVSCGSRGLAQVAGIRP